MNFAQSMLEYAIYISLFLVMLALVLVSIRVIRGPTLADRVLGLDQLVATAIGMIVIIAIKTGYELYIDIALALGLVGFLATAAFARYLFMARGGEADSGKIKPAARKETEQ